MNRLINILLVCCLILTIFLTFEFILYSKTEKWHQFPWSLLTTTCSLYVIKMSRVKRAKQDLEQY